MRTYSLQFGIKVLEALRSAGYTVTSTVPHLKGTDVGIGGAIAEAIDIACASQANRLRELHDQAHVAFSKLDGASDDPLDAEAYAKIVRELRMLEIEVGHKP